MHIAERDTASPSQDRPLSVGTPTVERSAAVNWYDHRPLHALYEAGKILAGPPTSGRVLSPVLNVLSSFMNLRSGAVALLVAPEDRLDDGGRNPYVLDEACRNPYVIAATTSSETPQPPDSGAMPRRVAETVLKTGVAVVIQNIALELPGSAPPPELVHAGVPAALLAVPICEHGLSSHVLGVLSAYRLQDPAEPLNLDQDRRILSMVANLVGQALRYRRMVLRDRERLISEAERYSKALEDIRAAAQPAPTGLPDIVGDSPPIRAVSERIRKVAPTRSTVLLRGESGTGKELFARALHQLSGRKDAPFIKVNCAALSETLLESELFGHEKGAFTGALAQKKGRFELADGGTLFLDEIGDISLAFQAKLLRALQEGEFERVGGTRTVRVDVRLIAATNKDLEFAVAKGEFRADLYFRICVIPIVLPPLRERPEDIPHLAREFLTRFNAENGTNLRFAPGAMGVIEKCFFPGNVRELENCINRVAALAAGPEIDPSELACQQDACLSAQLGSMRSLHSGAIGGLPTSRLSLPVLNAPPDSRDPASIGGATGPVRAPAPRPAPVSGTGSGTGSGMGPRDELIDAMERAGWVQAKAARLLGLTPRQLGYALKKHQIEVKKF
jgi:Nif-specific regulatory protein